MRTQVIRLLQRARAGVCSSEAAESVRASLYATASAGAVTKGVSQRALWTGLYWHNSRQQECLSRFAQDSLRQFTSSASLHVAPLTETAVEGNAEELVAEIDSLISRDATTAAEVADAAVSLAYLQVKGNRRIWGKLFEKAAALQGSFDAASLSNFLWAVTTANVGHFKTLYELTAPASKLLKTFTPTQLSIVVEAFGKGGVNDAAFLNAVSDHVSAKTADFKPSELSRILWAFAAAKQNDVKLAKAITKSLLEKEKDLTARDAVQAVWALAKVGRNDKTALDGLTKVVKAKAIEYPQDLAALAWALGTLGYKPDASLAQGIKGAVDVLSTTEQIHAAWGLAVTDSGDKDTFAALFKSISAAVDKSPETQDLRDISLLYQASVIVKDAKLDPKVAAYAAKIYDLGSSYKAVKRSEAVKEFRSDVAESVARALGHRYRPEINKFLSSVKQVVDGVTIDIVADIGGTKIAVEPVEANLLTSTAPVQPLGTITALGKVLESKGFKLVPIAQTEYAALADSKAKVGYVLSAVKKAVPALAGKVGELQKAADAPFDPYA